MTCFVFVASITSCNTVMSCKFRFCLVESGKKEETLKAMPWGNRQPPGWETHGVLCTLSGRLVVECKTGSSAMGSGSHMQIVDTWFFPSTNGS